jgi:pimeloyl-ACP methyl ester carboxylesterase
MPGRRRAPDVHDHERSRLLADELSGWLDHRRRAGELIRKPGTLDELARRRGRMNPRLSHEWLRHLVSVGARHDPDGWRWKIDPALRLGGFGPVRPEWNLGRLTGLGVPLLAILGTIREQMGAGLRVEDVEPHLPPGAQLMAMEDTGHFLHIERPAEIAALALDFLAASC